MEDTLRIDQSLEFNFKLAVNPEFQECILAAQFSCHAYPPHLYSLESHINFSTPIVFSGLIRSVIWLRWEILAMQITDVDIFTEWDNIWWVVPSG